MPDSLRGFQLAGSAAHLREHGADVSLATYDGRMREAGVGMGFELYLTESPNTAP